MKSKSLQQNISLYLIAFCQGLILYALYKRLDAHLWPYDDMVATHVTISSFTLVPILALLSITRENWVFMLRWLGAATLVIVLVSVYHGNQMIPPERVFSGSSIFIFSLTLLMICFKAIMYIQQLGDKEKISYHALYVYSWRNLLTIAEAFLFVGILWLILLLWAALFNILEIDFFKELFSKDWFVIPVTVTAFGLAIIISRELTHIIDNSSRLMQSLIKLLLPLLTFVSLIFLLTLPFKGLDLLWSTGKGTALILWMQALLLFFINSVYRDEPENRPYALPIHYFLAVGVVVLPVYSAIAFYGLWLRVDQYGLTVERCWALVVWFMLMLFAVGYLWGVITQRSHWTYTLSRVNVVGGLVLLALLIATNSPLLDFRKLTASSQFERLKTGAVKFEDFDFPYIRKHLGKAGYEHAMRLRDTAMYSAEQIARVDAIYAEKSYQYGRHVDGTVEMPEWQVKHFIDVPLWPAEASVPEGLYGHIAKAVNETHWMKILNPNTEKSLVSMRLIIADLDNDENNDYIFLAQRHHGYGSLKLLYTLQEGIWQKMSLISIGNQPIDLIAEDIEPVENRWKKLKIGQSVLRVIE